MTWRVDPPFRAGDATCAAIVETDVSARHVRRALVGHGRKAPVLVLVIRSGGVAGFDLDGRGYGADEIEALYPGAIAQATALASDG